MPALSPGMFATNAKNRLYNYATATDGNPRKFEAWVVENNTVKENTKILFMPKDLPGLQKGHLRDNPIPISRSFTDANGNSVVAKGTHATAFVAIWHNTDGYRTTAPQVQRGETVWVWQEGDSGIYRWEECGDGAKTSRRQETIIHSINADKPDGPDSEKHDSSNTYYTEMSSHNKSYTVGMSKSNGEVAGYKFQMNGEKGAIVLQDDVGNYIEIFTKDRRIVMMNQDQSYVELNGTNILVKCSDNLSIKVGGSINIEAGGDVSIKCASMKVDTPQTTFTGNVKIEKGLEVSGPSKMGGGGTVDGTLAVTGPVQLSGGTSSGVIHGSYIDT